MRIVPSLFLLAYNPRGTDARRGLLNLIKLFILSKSVSRLYGNSRDGVCDSRCSARARGASISMAAYNGTFFL